MAAAAVNSSAASGVAGAQARLAAAGEFAERAGLKSIASALSPSVDPELLASARRVSGQQPGGIAAVSEVTTTAPPSVPGEGVPNAPRAPRRPIARMSKASPGAPRRI